MLGVGVRMLVRKEEVGMGKEAAVRAAVNWAGVVMVWCVVVVVVGEVDKW